MSCSGREARLAPPRGYTAAMTRAKRVRRLSLGAPEPPSDYVGRTPGELLEIAWQLTLAAWAFTGKPVEPRLRRDAVRVVRGGR